MKSYKKQKSTKIVSMTVCCGSSWTLKVIDLPQEIGKKLERKELVTCDKCHKECETKEIQIEE